MGLTVIILIGMLLRLCFLSTQSLWADEAFTVLIAKMPLDNFVALIAKVDYHPLLYYLSLSVWGKTVLPRLAQWHAAPEACWRSFNLLIALALLLAQYLVGKDLGGKRLGFWAVLLTAFSSCAFSLDLNLRNYSLLALGVLLSFWGAAFFFERKVSGWFWFYVLASLLALYTNYLAIFALLTQNLLFLCLYRGKEIKRWLSAQGLIVLLFLPGLYVLLLQTRGSVVPNLTFLGKPDFSSLVGAYYFVFGGNFLIISKLACQLIVLLLLGGFVYGSQTLKAEKKTWLLVYGLLPVLGAYLVTVLTGKQIFAQRHCLYIYPVILLGLARGILQLWESPKAYVQYLSAGLVILFFAVNLTSLYNRQFKEIYKNPDWRGAASLLEADASARDTALIVNNRYQSLPLDFYLKKPFAHHFLYLDSTGRSRLAAGREPLLGQNYADKKKVDYLQCSGGVSEVLSQYSNVWLILNQEYYDDPQDNLKKWLDGHYNLVDSRIFWRANQDKSGNIRMYHYAVIKEAGLKPVR